MQFTIITLFPEFVENLKEYSIIGRAIKDKKIKLYSINLRDFGIGKHKQVDDKPYGGGPGMLLRADVMSAAIKKAKKGAPKTKIILLSPEGEKFDQKMAASFVGQDIILVCGHYEGFDERIKTLVDQVVSVGDYILSGGEIPAMVIVEAVSRLIPNVLGNSKSLDSESFSTEAPFDFPQYTRPEEFEGQNVPEILLSGNHNEIKKWREDKTGRS